MMRWAWNRLNWTALNSIIGMIRNYFSFLLVLSSAFLLGCDGGKNAVVAFDPATAVYQEFSGEKALAEVKKFVDAGPHPAGTEASKAYILHMEETLKGHGWETQRQVFTDPTPLGDIEFTNLRARFPAKAGKPVDWEQGGHVLLCSHFDTKYYPFINFVGANDGGSSTGALLEAARCLALNPATASQIELVFFDGEEAYVEFTATDGLYGSRHYTGKLRRIPKTQWPRAMVLFDLIGDQDLAIRVPPNGSQELLGHLFSAAKELGTRSSFGTARHPITDDHEPFNHLRIPAIDIIDLDYPHWHKESDTFDKISAQNIEIVAKTTLLMIEKFLLSQPAPVAK